MAILLPANELTQYYPEAASMTENDRAKYLARANAYALGAIGSVPIYTPELPDKVVKTAVAMAFEIFAEGQETQTNHVNGNITEAVPPGYYVRKANDPLELVDKMLTPYAAAYKKALEEAGQSSTDTGAMFL